MTNPTVFNHALITLDLSSIDPSVLQYSKYLVEKFSISEVTIVHIIPTYYVAENVRWTYRDWMEDINLVDTVTEQIRQNVNTILKPSKQLKIKIKVLEGRPYRKLLEVVENDQIDLVIAGKKEKDQGSGVTALRLAKNVKTHVIFVPHHATIPPTNILLPIDFSGFSLRSFEAALTLKKDQPNLQLTAVHYIDLPAAAYHINRNFKDFFTEEKSNIRARFKSFCSRHHLDSKHTKFEVYLNEEFNIARHILMMVKDQKFDLIVLGARGHSPFDRFIFGSITEKLVSYDLKVPVLVIR